MSVTGEFKWLPCVLWCRINNLYQKPREGSHVKWYLDWFFGKPLLKMCANRVTFCGQITSTAPNSKNTNKNRFLWLISTRCGLEIQPINIICLSVCVIVSTTRCPASLRSTYCYNESKLPKPVCVASRTMGGGGGGSTSTPMQPLKTHYI